MDFSENDNKELMQLFQTESEEIIEKIFASLFSLEKQPANKELISGVYRDLHSLKGAVRMVGYNNIQSIIHKMEDIFDAINEKKFTLDPQSINVISRSLEIVSKYLQESIRNNREIIDDDFKATLSNLEYILDVELNENSMPQTNSGGIPGLDIPGLDIPGLDIPVIDMPNNDLSFNVNPSIKEINDSDNKKNNNNELLIYQEEINFSFNKCFDIIDSIVPEEESQEIVLLKEEIQKIYSYFKDSDLYEVKSSLENISTKIEFVMNATNTLTISEILELRNELSSAASKHLVSQSNIKDLHFLMLLKKFLCFKEAAYIQQKLKTIS